MMKLLAVAFSIGLPQIASADPIASIRYFEHSGHAQISASRDAVDRNTPFAIASIGKTMTAVALLRLVARGEVRLDDPVRDSLPPEITAGLGGLHGITLRHLLGMTSGLSEYLTDEYINDALGDPDRVQTPRAALSYAYGARVLFRPGRGFDYSNTNYVLAGLILEQVSNRSYATALKSEVFGPAGMRNSFVFGTRALPRSFPSGHEGRAHVRSYYAGQGFGDGGVISSAADVARFYKALFIDKSLLPKPVLAALLHDPKQEGYGLGIEVEDHVLGHSGGDLGFSSDVRINTTTGAIAVILIARGDADTGWAWDAVEGP